MSADLIAKLKDTEAGRWSHWLWEFLYNNYDYCQQGINKKPYEKTRKAGLEGLKQLYTLADWLEGQAFKQIEREIPYDARKLMEIFHRQQRREEENAKA